jgi:RNA recognition motif-containing protein
MNPIVNNSNLTQTTPKENKTVLHFADLEQSVTEYDIKCFLGDYQNKIVHIELKYNKNSPLKSAIVIFKEYQDANSAKDDLNMKKIKNRTCRIMWHDKEGIKVLSYHSENNNIFVKNIPLEINPREVFEFFLTFGEISSVKINENPDGSHKGYGYISYENSTSAIKAIEQCNNKAVFTVKFPNTLITVDYFKPSVTRSGNTGVNPYIMMNNTKVKETNCSLFVKNISKELNENDLKAVFENKGNITYFKPNYSDDKKSFIKTCILSYDNENTARKAEKEINGLDVKGSILEVEKMNFINENSTTIKDNSQNNWGNNALLPSNKSCALYFRNLPDSINEEILRKIVSEYGKVNNIILYKKNIMQKIGDTFKEVEIHNGSGQVHYDSSDEASLAKETLNNKFLPGYETWKLPFFVDFYLSPKDRAARENQMINNFFPVMMQPQSDMMGMQSSMMGQNPNMNMTGNPYYQGQIPDYGYQVYQTGQTGYNEGNKAPYNKMDYNNNNYNQNSKYGGHKNNNYNNNNYGGGMNNNNNYNNNYNNKGGQYNNNNKYNNNYNNNYNNKGGNKNYHNKNNYNNNYSNNIDGYYNNNYKNNDVQEITEKMENTNINNNNNQNTKQINQVPDPETFVKVNIDQLNSLTDNSSKKEYLGEIIFNNINSHELVTRENVSYQEVGKITGMILGIEDLNEIILPCSYYHELTSRIEEALKLIRS